MNLLGYTVPRAIEHVTSSAFGSPLIVIEILRIAVCFGISILEIHFHIGRYTNSVRRS